MFSFLLALIIFKTLSESIIDNDDEQFYVTKMKKVSFSQNSDDITEMKFFTIHISIFNIDDKVYQLKFEFLIKRYNITVFNQKFLKLGIHKNGCPKITNGEMTTYNKQIDKLQFENTNYFIKNTVFNINFYGNYMQLSYDGIQREVITNKKIQCNIVEHIRQWKYKQ